MADPLADLAAADAEDAKARDELQKELGTPKETPKSAKPAAKAKSAPAPRATSLEKRLQGAIEGMGQLISFADQFDGYAITAGAPSLAAALDNLAKESPRARRAMERMLTGGAWGEVIIATAMIAVPIMAHHGMLPSGKFPLTAPPGSEPTPGDLPKSPHTHNGDEFHDHDGGDAPHSHLDQKP